MLVETIYSLSGEMPPAQAADEAADGAALRPGALMSGSIRQTCAVRKLSAAGAVLHVDHPTFLGERMELELTGGERHEGTIAWRRGAELGLRFDAQADVYAMIAQDIVGQEGERRRMPRVELACPALLETEAGTILASTRDISQGGLKLDVPFPLEARAKVVVTPEGFRPVEGVVRWSEGRVAGIAFVPELRWQEVMLWLKEMRGRAGGPGWAAPAPPAARERAGRPAAGPQPAAPLHLPARVREGTRRWSIEVDSITANSVEFESFAALPPGSLLWIVLPGLEGWPARIVSTEDYRYICAFAQPLHPAVLERILELARRRAA